jgi:hypothetical protein
MGFYPIHPFIHEYDFPYHDEVLEHKNDILKQFKEKIGIKHADRDTYTVDYVNEPLRKKIEQRFDKVVHDNYSVDPRMQDLSLNVYVQNKEHSNSLWHDHVFSATINAVFYLNLPKVGGGLQFIYQGEQLTLQPKINKIYLFPYWLQHRPLPQEDNDYRICFNLQYMCKTRPAHKIAGNWFSKDKKINVIW